jgi:hypothetical protein
VSLVALALGCHDYNVYSKADGLDDPVWDTASFGISEVPEQPPTTTCQELVLPEAVQVDESCLVEVSTGNLETVVEWELTTFENFPEYRDVLMAPVVGELTGDGMPDIVVLTDAGSAGEVGDRRQGVLRLLNGADGQEHWATQVAYQDVDGQTAQIFPYRYSNAALGDIDGDGEGEIVIVSMVLNGPVGEVGSTDTEIPQVDPFPPADNEVDLCYLTAWEADGSLKWVAWEPWVKCAGHAPLLADLEGDGRVEAVLGNIFIDATDGTLIAVGEGGIGGTRAYPDMGVHSIAVDLDGDGTQEVIAGNTIYEHDASTRCETGLNDGFAAAADLDGDGFGEVVVVGNGRVDTFEHDCTPASTWVLSGGGNGGPPTIADFDADGAPEVGIADAGVYAVYEVDGSVLWTAEVVDESSHATGSAVFDFEGDGRPEVVYADETTLWIYDGSTGEVRLQDGRHESRTLHELPTVVDVDGDGQAEIIVPNGGSHHENMWWGLYVLGGIDSDWVSGGSVWNQHAYSITNVRDDLSIPPPTSNWPEHNNFRSGDLYGSYGGNRPEPTLRAEGCSDECNLGRAVVLVSVGNAGLGTLEPVEVVVRDESGAVLETRSTPASVESGELTSPMRFLLPPSHERVTVELRPLDVECDPDDEEKLWVELSCP